MFFFLGVWRKYTHSTSVNLRGAEGIDTVFPGGSDRKESSCSARDPCLIPGLGRPPGEGNDNTLQYSCYDNNFIDLMPNVIFVVKFNAGIESFVETMTNRRRLLLNGAYRRCSSLRLLYPVKMWTYH